MSFKRIVLYIGYGTPSTGGIDYALVDQFPSLIFWYIYLLVGVI